MSTRTSPFRRGSMALLCLALSAPAACLKVPDEGSQAPSEASAPSSAAELLERYIDALGGSDALRAIEYRTIEARITFKGREDCLEGDPSCRPEDTEGQFILYNSAEGKLFRRTLIGEQVHERGYDGKEGWQYQMDPQVLLYEGSEAARASQEDAVLHWYFDLEERGIEASLLPSRETEDGRMLDGIAWGDAKGLLPPRELWFDRASGLLAEEREPQPDLDAEAVRRYADYQEVDGIQIPFKISQMTREGDLRQEVELFTTRVHHETIPAERFAVPALPAPEPAKDMLLGELERVRGEAKAAPKDPAAQISWARIAFMAAHFDEAREAAKATLKADPREPEAVWILARVHILAGELGAAKKQLAKAAKLGVRGDQIARQQAWIDLRQLKFSAAAKSLAAAGFPEMGERYEVFTGKPLAWGKSKSCRATLDLLSDEAPIIEVEADGRTLRLLLDTGAADMIISDQVALSMVVSTDARVPIAASGPALPHGQIDRMKLGELEILGVPAVMFPEAALAEMSGVDEQIDGVLGARALWRSQLRVDLAGKKLHIVPNEKRCTKELAADRVGKELPLWVHETHYLYTLGRVNGAEGFFLINTGMRGADLTANARAYAHAGVGAPPLREGVPPMVSIDSLQLGEVGWKQQQLEGAWGFLEQQETTDGFRLDGMIGPTILGQDYTLDFLAQRIYLRETPAEAPSEDKGAAAP